MTHGPEHHIEHAGHAAHAVHDPFDRRVTISIAIVAAVLAYITMLSHRAHNETLRLQGEALSLQTQASIKHTEAANKWAFYQAKNLRSHQYGALADLLEALPANAPVQDKLKKDWTVRKDRYEQELGEIKAEAEALDKKSGELQKHSVDELTRSHEVHAKADRFDFGELGLQLGVVLCSLAILTKNRGYWLLGIASAVAGLGVALTGVLGLFMGHH